ncbi:DUF1080 domain-containing protein [Gemmata sp. JC717]|uniref:3-keto-disaccharide hydrolase n=1 Tax=Gemmata algarum TaxID=2975278 RepID=UPI0021BB4DC6|nr:DUF1080 domain-containing protein [Gemmata algarum]MDY3553132.1 DUF1080 domain-containing protein [Gemmata algarum]
MKVCLVSAAIAIAIATSTARSEDNKAPAEFTALFNGKDLTGWKGHTTMVERAKQKPEDLAKLQAARTKTATEHWKVIDGAIHCDGKGGVSLVTDKDYGNFELMVDWKIEKNGDSGLYLRGQPQVQIWDSENSPGARNEDKNTGSGGLWNNPLPADAAKSTDNMLKLKEGQKVGKIPLKKADKPVGEWNTFHIIVLGDEVTVNLNGSLVVQKAKLLNYWERGKPVPEKGPIELQFHGDPLWFKNIYIKELK